MKTAMEIDEFYKRWCKKTKRNGGILIGSSIRELMKALVGEINIASMPPQSYYDGLTKYNKWSKDKMARFHS